MTCKGWTNIAFDRPNKKKEDKLPVDSSALERAADGCKKRCGCRDCAKCILIVGGITKFKQLYRDLIERHGHECEYLDGYMRRGDKLLEKKVMKCDIVLCPVDCNSHNACASAKKFCRKHGKPIIMLNSSGVTNMTQAIKSMDL